RRAIAPTTAALQYMHDAADDSAIVRPLDAPDIRRQVRFDPLPLLIAQPKQVVAHDPNPLPKTNQDRIVRAEKLMSSDPSFSAAAELSCCHQLHWPFPRNVICTYFETSARINGLDIVGLGLKRPSLLEACDLFDIPHMEKERKAHMRDIILNNTDY